MSLGKLKARVLTAGSPLWKLYLILRGVVCGRGLVVIGRPGINRKLGSAIRLGNHVVLCSSGSANPVAEGGRCRLATLSPGAQLILHDHVGLSSVVICAALKVEIGEGTQIGGGTMILDTDFHPRGIDGTLLTDPLALAKAVSIGKHCFIGARAIILKGVVIGDGAVVGAGAIVTKNVQAGGKVAGNPARLIISTC